MLSFGLLRNVSAASTPNNTIRAFLVIMSQGRDFHLFSLMTFIKILASMLKNASFRTSWLLHNLLRTVEKMTCSRQSPTFNCLTAVCTIPFLCSCHPTGRFRDYSGCGMRMCTRGKFWNADQSCAATIHTCLISPSFLLCCRRFEHVGFPPGAVSIRDFIQHLDIITPKRFTFITIVDCSARILVGCHYQVMSCIRR